MDELEKIRKKKLEELKKKFFGGVSVSVIEVGDDDFNESVVEQSKRIPVVVDFWAPWCMPCMILKPVLEKLAKEFEGKFILAKVNVDEARRVATEYGIMSIPNVKLFKDGKVVDEFVGALPESKVREWLKENLE
ncbi:MAG TPA: thioredoxin [Candidatus Aenigmarchaeota archaeon]|nr:thioredoxin [Candidatus Aenigmarchaeota archaeon]